jgi:hypothetical protein
MRVSPLRLGRRSPDMVVGRSVLARRHFANHLLLSTAEQGYGPQHERTLYQQQACGRSCGGHDHAPETSVEAAGATEDVGD